MIGEPVFLELAQVLPLHASELAEHGGSEGVRDAGLLESEIEQPRATFFGEYLHDDLAAMARAYAFHVAENQPFVDGNKRAAVAAALTFLTRTGVSRRPRSSPAPAGARRLGRPRLAPARTR